MEPAAHSIQSLVAFDPVTSMYCPASHTIHDNEAAASAYCPAAHAIHDNEAAASAYSPAAHAIHDDEPSAVAYCPTAHSIHEAAALAYCPGKHSIQSEPDVSGLRHGALASVGSRYTRHNTIVTTDKM
jgi:hypothetical protein